MRDVKRLEMVAILFAPFGEGSWEKAQKLIKVLKEHPSYGTEKPLVRTTSPPTCGMLLTSSVLHKALVACKCDVKPQGCKIIDSLQYKTYAERFGVPVFEVKAHCTAEEAMKVVREMAIWFRARKGSAASGGEYKTQKPSCCTS
jgi:S-adenosylhomocysteine hydrolase